MRSNPRVVEQSYGHVQHITRLTQTGLEGRVVLLDGDHSRPKFEIARSRKNLPRVFSVCRIFRIQGRETEDILEYELSPVADILSIIVPVRLEFTQEIFSCPAGPILLLKGPRLG